MILDQSRVLSCNAVMRFAILLSAVALSLSATQAAEFSLDDDTIILGKRVGPIVKGMTSADLKTLLGKKVKLSKLDGPEGTVIEGAKAFEGTDRELEIMFNPESKRKEISDIVIVGKAWKFENGLKLGLTMTAIEKINGGPYKMNGFGWDYGGFADFEGGKLAGMVSVRFDSGDADLPDSLSGDRQIATTDKKLRALNPKASHISVFFR
jgi:hypothetical protein